MLQRRPFRPHRAQARSLSLEASAPQRLICGTKAMERRRPLQAAIATIEAAFARDETGETTEI
jgi:hypothetical protein